ncbi:MAG: formate C-acetyltransferase/glycerol dehydratase family glycyl radical enzyme [Christensenellaceae bacterium]
MKRFIEELKQIEFSGRIENLRTKMLKQPRYVSIEQAKIITSVYKNNPNLTAQMKRALSLKEALLNLEITIDKDELIVGNRTKESGAGVVFPEAGINWLKTEIDSLPTRPQDRFFVKEEDKEFFFNELVPFWEGKTLEDKIGEELPQEIKDCEVVGKLNQQDHAQGHICPDVSKWLKLGPIQIMKAAQEKANAADEDKKEYYLSVAVVLEAACAFIKRYANLSRQMAENEMNGESKKNLVEIAQCCENISENPPKTYREALQSVWFLFVILQLESNASSFSPGRADQYLYPYYMNDINAGRETLQSILYLTEAWFIKFNEIVYLRNTASAAFFAGFPIGFNIAIGGQTKDGHDAANELSYILLRAMEHTKLRQPNLSARVFSGSNDLFIDSIARAIGLGTGMPQLFNDDVIIPALLKSGYSATDANDYAIVGCVEISSQGNNLGFSDAAMFNGVKALELTLNNGVCTQTNKQIGLRLGKLTDFNSYEELENAYRKQMEYFIEKMLKGCYIIEKHHKNVLPTPFLSSVIDDCMENGTDVTAGGANYNFSGIQLIQIANIADSLAAIKTLVFEKKEVTKEELMENLLNNFKDERFRLIMMNHAPKYGNDDDTVDFIGEKWLETFYSILKKYKNYRGGEYIVGLYTVSAHVPMGLNVGATPDGRRSKEPLADGGLSAVYGRDINGPTALLNSVAKIDTKLASNGSLLNMKFSPKIFSDENGIENFISLIRSFITLQIGHVQFNVLNKDDLLAAKLEPEKYANLLVRVAGYTANYVDLSDALQNEILKRTEYGN